MIAEYKATETVWGILKPQTQKSYNRAFAVLDSIKTAPIGAMTRASIISFRDKIVFEKHGRWMANYAVTTLAVLFAFSVDRGIVKSNPLQERVKKIVKPPGTPKANRALMPQELQAIFSEAPAHIKLPLAPAACLGLRFRDIMSAPLSALRDVVAWLRTNKTGQTVTVPIHPVLRAALASRRKSDAIHICVNSNGQPWAGGFNASWIKFRSRLEEEGKFAKGLTIHRLRHARKTAEGGRPDRR